MTASVVDGALKFRCSLVDFYRQPIIVEKVARKGIMIPPPDDVDVAAPPALARIDPAEGLARWIADCPDCRSAEYVWLDTLVFFCCGCGNALIGSRWRLLVMPAFRLELEALLMARPTWVVVNGRVVDPRAWVPSQTLEDVRAQNAALEAQAS